MIRACREMPTELHLLVRGCKAATHDEKIQSGMMYQDVLDGALAEEVVFLNDLLPEANGT